MMCSANEVMTLAAKAARGAGAPPAQATDFGIAALRHLQAGRDVQNLNDALTLLPDGPVLQLPLALLQMIENAAGDSATGGFGQAARSDLALSYLDAQPYETKVETVDGKVQVTLFLAQAKGAPVTSRVRLPDTLAATFLRYAARLLVPESEASRLLGAGAGLTDND
ncbi:MAG: hypothetical protein WA782_07455 [Sulfitobacter sp.]